MIVEYAKEEPLAPVKRMVSVFPIVGTVIAMFGGSAFVSFVELALQYMLHAGHLSPLAAGLSLCPQIAGVVVSATLLVLLFSTRFLPVLAFGGMLLVIAGGALLAAHGAKPDVWLGVSGLLGVGAGATVSPGLFMASLSLPSQLIGRIFALVELVRSVPISCLRR
ncbi:MAG: hypothetical protein ACLQKK_10020 [Rhodomicrobium sp.]